MGNGWGVRERCQVGQMWQWLTRSVGMPSPVGMNEWCSPLVAGFCLGFHQNSWKLVIWMQVCVNGDVLMVRSVVSIVLAWKIVNVVKFKAGVWVLKGWMSRNKRWSMNVFCWHIWSPAWYFALGEIHSNRCSWSKLLMNEAINNEG